MSAVGLDPRRRAALGGQGRGPVAELPACLRRDQRIDAVQVVRVVRVEYVAGAGTEDDPVTRFVRFYDPETGELLADTRPQAVGGR